MTKHFYMKIDCFKYFTTTTKIYSNSSNRSVQPDFSISLVKEGYRQFNPFNLSMQQTYVDLGQASNRRATATHTAQP